MVVLALSEGVAGAPARCPQLGTDANELGHAAHAPINDETPGNVGF
jgi:hypothetical protein